MAYLDVPRSVARLALACFAVYLTGCPEVDRSVTALEKGIQSLDKGVDSFDRGIKVLEDVKKNLDDEVYKKQVGDLIRETGQVAEITGQSGFDFVRARLVEDLERMKAAVLGKQPPPRKPFLATDSVGEIDFRSSNLTTVKLVGWNLDVVEKEPATYKLKLRNADPMSTRPIEFGSVTFQGQYAISINLSNNGSPLKFYDNALVFEGFAAKYEIPIVNSAAPPPPPKITNIKVNMQTNSHKEAAGGVILIFAIGDKEIHRSGHIGCGQTWTKGTQTPYESGVNAEYGPGAKLRMTVDFPPCPDERNINWKATISVAMTNDKGDRIELGSTSGFYFHNNQADDPVPPGNAKGSRSLFFDFDLPPTK